MQYRDLDIHFESQGDGYRIELKSPMGSASGIFRLPFGNLEVENLILRMGQTRRGVRKINSPQMMAAQGLGEKLFEGLFRDEVYARFRSTLDQARLSGEGVRVRLHLQRVPELASIPWEYLTDPNDKRFLALSNSTPVIRFVEVAQPVPPLRAALPLRILGVISRPTDIAALDVEAEKQNLERAVAELATRGQAGVLEIEWLPRATLQALQSALQQRQFHIFHFVGHGAFDAAAEEGVLLFEDEQGRGRVVSASVLGTLLHDHQTLRLAVLNACEGARQGREDPFAGVAPALLRAGVPAAVAMQFEVTDSAAVTFARAFYGAVANGLAVDAALAEARKAIFTDDNDVEWGTPVLFSSVADGVIFQLPAARQAMVQPDELYRQVIALARDERWQEAWSAWQALRRQAPDYPDEAQVGELARKHTEAGKRYAQMSGLVAARQWKKALDVWREILELNPTHLDPEGLEAKAHEALTAEQTKTFQQQNLERLYMEVGGLVSLRQWGKARGVWRQIRKLDARYLDRNGYAAQIPPISWGRRLLLGFGAVVVLALAAMVVVTWLRSSQLSSRPLIAKQGVAPAAEAPQLVPTVVTIVQPVTFPPPSTATPPPATATPVATPTEASVNETTAGIIASMQDSNVVTPVPTSIVAPSSEEISNYIPVALGSYWKYSCSTISWRQTCAIEVMTDPANPLLSAPPLWRYTQEDLLRMFEYAYWVNDTFVIEWDVLGTPPSKVYTVRFQPPLVLLQKPLQKGTFWRSEGTSTLNSSRPGNVSVQSTVIGSEQVKVPAGTFETVHVRVLMAPLSTRDLWLAAGVGIVKQIWDDGQTTEYWELTDYRIGE